MADQPSRPECTGAEGQPTWMQPIRWSGTERYLTLPVLDAEAPTADQLDRAVAWLDGALASGPVLVHCALGHSRSATVVAAWQAGHEAQGDALALEADLRRVRPGVRLTPAQHVALDAWRADRAGKSAGAAEGPGPAR